MLIHLVILMMGSLVPAFVGMLTLALLPSKGLIWTRWAMYMMTVFGQLPGLRKYYQYNYLFYSVLTISLVIWTFLPSNVAGRTKKSVTATLLFVGYCVGNAVGAQVMQAKDAPRYITGITVCASMYGLEFLSMGLWRTYCKSCIYQRTLRLSLPIANWISLRHLAKQETCPYDR